MEVKINCLHYNHVNECKCRDIKRKWFMFLGKPCIEYFDQNDKCKFKIKTIKPKINL